VCPLLVRVLKERSAEMKKKGAQIVGSIGQLVRDKKDFDPYFPQLLPHLQSALVDPIPDVRATTAVAFGTLARALPDETFTKELLPWLFLTLKSSESQVERSGAAHGLSEVLVALGRERIDDCVEEVIQRAHDTTCSADVREGYLGLFVWLPGSMKDSFLPYVEKVLRCLMLATADESKSVRDIATRAAGVICSRFGMKASVLVMPILEDTLFNECHYARHSAINLVGGVVESLMKGARQFGQDLLLAEGVMTREKRQFTLAALYMVRSDEWRSVAQAAAQVWKAIVQNTPRTLKEIMPILIRRIITNLASGSAEKVKVASRCVGELVEKLGGRVMQEIMPIFEQSIKSNNPLIREGVCIALQAVIDSASRDLIRDHVSSIIPAVQQAICDPEESVRRAASAVIAHEEAGEQAIHAVIPGLLEQMLNPPAMTQAEVDPSRERAMDGLSQLVLLQPRVVMNKLLPKLCKEPVDLMKVRGLGCLAACDSDDIIRSFSVMIPAVVSAMVCPEGLEDDSDLRIAAIASAGQFMKPIDGHGLSVLVSELTAAREADASPERQRAVAHLFAEFLRTTTASLAAYASVIQAPLLEITLTATEEEVWAAGHDALGALSKAKTANVQVPQKAAAAGASGDDVQVLAVNVSEMRDCIESIAERYEWQTLPGLSFPGSLEHLYPIYQVALINGAAEARQVAAKGLGDLVTLTAKPILEAHRTFAGPLIRVLGDRFDAFVKVAIIDTLRLLLEKVGPSLKQFFPQLQTAHVKCLSDTDAQVRSRSCATLGLLAGLNPRTDSLLTKLAKGASAPDADVRRSTLQALVTVQSKLTPMNAATQEAVSVALLEAIVAEDEEERVIAARGVALFLVAVPEKATEILGQVVVERVQHPNWIYRHGACCTLAGLCAEGGEAGYTHVREAVGDFEDALKKLLEDDKVPVQSAAVDLFLSIGQLPTAEPLPESLSALGTQVAKKHGKKVAPPGF